MAGPFLYSYISSLNLLFYLSRPKYRRIKWIWLQVLDYYSFLFEANDGIWNFINNSSNYKEPDPKCLSVFKGKWYLNRLKKVTIKFTLTLIKKINFY